MCRDRWLPSAGRTQLPGTATSSHSSSVCSAPTSVAEIVRRRRTQPETPRTVERAHPRRLIPRRAASTSSYGASPGDIGRRPSRGRRRLDHPAGDLDADSPAFGAHDAQIELPAAATTTSATWARSVPIAASSRPSSVTTRVGGVEWGDARQSDGVPLGVVGDDDEALRRLDERPVRLRLEQVRRRVAGPLGHAVDAEEHLVEVQRGQRLHGQRADEGVRRRADAADEHDGATGALVPQQRLADADRVGDDDDVVDVDEAVRQMPRRRAGGESDRRSGTDEAGGGGSDRLLLGGLLGRLGEEAGLQRRRRQVAGQGGAPVDLGEQPLAGQGVEVTADRHVADPELVRSTP